MKCMNNSNCTGLLGVFCKKAENKKCSCLPGTFTSEKSSLQRSAQSHLEAHGHTRCNSLHSVAAWLELRLQHSPGSWLS